MGSEYVMKMKVQCPTPPHFPLPRITVPSESPSSRVPLCCPMSFLCIPMPFLCTFYDVSMRFLYRIRETLPLFTCRFPREYRKTRGRLGLKNKLHAVPHSPLPTPHSPLPILPNCSKLFQLLQTDPKQSQTFPNDSQAVPKRSNHPKPALNAFCLKHTPFSRGLPASRDNNCFDGDEEHRREMKRKGQIGMKKRNPTCTPDMPPIGLLLSTGATIACQNRVENSFAHHGRFRVGGAATLVPRRKSVCSNNLPREPICAPTHKNSEGGAQNGESSPANVTSCQPCRGRFAGRKAQPGEPELGIHA